MPTWGLDLALLGLEGWACPSCAGGDTGTGHHPDTQGAQETGAATRTLGVQAPRGSLECNPEIPAFPGPKDWSFSFSIIPSKEIPGLISFRMDWLDLLAVQGTLKSLLQHHSSKACRGTFGGRRKAVRDRLALQGGTGDFP